jgi:hypothetical protein
MVAWMHERIKNIKLQAPKYKTCPSPFEGQITKNKSQIPNRAIYCLGFWSFEFVISLEFGA